MSSARTVTVLPDGVDPLARLRSITPPPGAGVVQQPALLVGPTSITTPLGPPGPPGSGGGLPDVIDGGTPYDTTGA